MRVAKFALFVLCSTMAGWLGLLALGLAFAEEHHPTVEVDDVVVFIIAPLLLLAAGLWGHRKVDDAIGRPCPRCAADTPRGVVICPACKFDFGTLVPPQPPER